MYIVACITIITLLVNKYKFKIMLAFTSSKQLVSCAHLQGVGLPSSVAGVWTRGAVVVTYSSVLSCAPRFQIRLEILH